PLYSSAASDVYKRQHYKCVGLRRVASYGDTGYDCTGILFAVVHHLKIPAFEKILLFSPAMKYFRLPDIKHK
ncbi:hypothetical protein, partial [Methanosarcina mazei]|uniref:hypothetical protein n=1 Tax=Methanosarcina mazei TaxID=2209 RepID=UPI001F1D1179